MALVEDYAQFLRPQSLGRAEICKHETRTLGYNWCDACREGEAEAVLRAIGPQHRPAGALSGVAAWIRALPPDALASIGNAYNDAHQAALFTGKLEASAQAFRDALLSLAPPDVPGAAAREAAPSEALTVVTAEDIRAVRQFIRKSERMACPNCDAPIMWEQRLLKTGWTMQRAACCAFCGASTEVKEPQMRRKK